MHFGKFYETLVPRWSPLSLTMLLAIGSATPAYGSLITNGSFESASVNPEGGLGFITLSSGSSVIDGWQVRGPETIDYIGNLWVASDGVRSLDLSGTPGPGGIEQAFTTVPGTEYQVAFDLAGNPQAGSAVKELLVTAAGQSQVFTFDVTGSTLQDLGWVERTWNFTASSTTTVLAFDSPMRFGDGGPALDNIAVVAVPEPTSASLIGMGLLMITRRRKRFE